MTVQATLSQNHQVQSHANEVNQKNEKLWKGRKLGVFDKWQDCVPSVSGFLDGNEIVDFLSLFPYKFKVKALKENPHLFQELLGTKRCDHDFLKLASGWQKAMHEARSFFTTYEPRSNPQFLSQLQPITSHVRELRIEVGSDLQLESFRMQFSQLKKCQINGQQISLQFLLTHFTALEELEFSSNYPQMIVNESPQLSSLTSLDLKTDLICTSHQLEFARTRPPGSTLSFLQSLKQLERFISPKVFSWKEYESLRGLTSLKELSINFYYADAEDPKDGEIQFFDSLTSLRDLTLEIHRLTDEGLSKILTKVSNITSLALWECDSLTKKIALQHIASLPQLEEFAVNRTLDEQELELLTKAPKLKSIEVSDIDIPKASTLQCTQIEELTLGSILDCNELINFEKLFPNLKSLYLMHYQGGVRPKALEIPHSLQTLISNYFLKDTPLFLKEVTHLQCMGKIDPSKLQGVSKLHFVEITQCTMSEQERAELRKALPDAVIVIHERSLKNNLPHLFFVG